MKKIVGVSMMVLFCLSFSSVASAGKFSLGAFGGMNIPIAQKDVGSGSVFGAKGRAIVLPFLGVEPNFVISKYGDKDIKTDDGQMIGTRKGGNITSFGLDAVIGTFGGFSKARFYGILGFNTNTYKRDGVPNQTRMGVSIGTGIEFFAIDVLSVEARARVHNMSLKGGGGRDNLELTGGLNYYFGPK